MHVPVEINVQQIEKKVPSLFVSITADGVEEVRDDDITPDDRIHSPGNAHTIKAGTG